MNYKKFIDNRNEAIKEKAIRKYEEICKARENKKALEDELWNAIGVDTDEDCVPFTESEELDGLMKEHMDALTLKLAGIEKSLPRWIEETEDQAKESDGE